MNREQHIKAEIILNLREDSSRENNIERLTSLILAREKKAQSRIYRKLIGKIGATELLHLLGDIKED